MISRIATERAHATMERVVQVCVGPGGSFVEVVQDVYGEEPVLAPRGGAHVDAAPSALELIMRADMEHGGWLCIDHPQRACSWLAEACNVMGWMQSSLARIAGRSVV